MLALIINCGTIISSFGFSLYRSTSMSHSCLYYNNFYPSSPSISCLWIIIPISPFGKRKYISRKGNNGRELVIQESIIKVSNCWIISHSSSSSRFISDFPFLSFRSALEKIGTVPRILDPKS